MGPDASIRPDRATPSAWEAAFLKRSLLTLQTLEYALPAEFAKATGFVAEGAAGTPMCAVYSKEAFDLILQQMGGEIVDAYVLPHLPPQDAHLLQAGIAGGEAAYRVANAPLLNAKVKAHDELVCVEKEVEDIQGRFNSLMDQLVLCHGRIATVLKSDGNNVSMPLDLAGLAELITIWENEMDRARDMSVGARRRLVFATLLATFWAAEEDEDGEFAAREGRAIAMGDIQGTLLRLALDLQQRVFGTYTEIPDAMEGKLHKRTVVALKRLICEIGVEMKHYQFVGFSLETSRCDLIKELGNLSHLELWLNVMKSLQAVLVSLADLQRLKEEVLQSHLTHPTLLGGHGKI